MTRFQRWHLKNEMLAANFLLWGMILSVYWQPFLDG